MQFSERDHGVPRVGETVRPNVARSRFALPFPFPVFPVPFRFLLFATIFMVHPLTRLPFKGKRNSGTRNAFVERVFSISLNECVATLFSSLLFSTTIYPKKEFSSISLALFQLLLVVKSICRLMRSCCNFVETPGRGKWDGMEEETDLFEPLELSYYCIFYFLKMLKHCSSFNFRYAVIRWLWIWISMEFCRTFIKIIFV